MPEVPPPNSTVLAELEAILSSSDFSASPRISELLRHVVTKTLNNEVEQLNGYAIGLDVFGRNETFEPAHDSIVRVQMTRLRKMLEQHYAAGRGGPEIRIAIPKGSYVARFERMDRLGGPREDTGSYLIDDRHRAPASAEGGRIAAPAGGRSISRRTLIAATSALVALLVLAFVAYRQFWPGAHEDPRIFIAEYKAIDDSDETRLVAKGLQHDLIAQLAQYPDLGVLAVDTVSRPGELNQLVASGGVDYWLAGSIEKAGATMKINNTLIAADTRKAVWAETVSFDASSVDNVFRAQKDISEKVASTLGQPHGIIQNASRSRLATTRSSSYGSYACVLSAYEYMRYKSETGHRALRNCLESSVARNPNYSTAWAMLSLVYGDEARYGFNLRPRTSPARQSLEAARKAVAVDPNNATAHEYLGFAQFYLGRDAEADQSFRTALRLSPNNAEVLAGFGWKLALSGEEGDTIEQIKRAIDLNPGHPPWYWGGLAIAAIRHGKTEKALRMSELYADDGVMSDYVRAAALRINGRGGEADAILRRVAASNPALAQRGNDFLRRNRIPADLEDHIFGK